MRAYLCSIDRFLSQKVSGNYIRKTEDTIPGPLVALANPRSFLFLTPVG